MLTNCLAACTHLPSTVSQLFEPQVQKNRHFYVPQLTFLFPLETPLRLSRHMLHGWKDNSMLAKPIAACTYLSSIVSELYDAYKSMRKSKNRYFYHIFVSPGDAPGAITLNVVRMESGFDAYKLPRNMYPSIFNSFPVIRTTSAKNRNFHVPRPTFLFPLETPMRLSHNMIIKIAWMERQFNACQTPRSM